MSNIYRDYEKSSNNNQRRNNKDENYHKKMKRSNEEYNSQKILTGDAKVFIGNVPTDNITDGELLQFFKPFGKILDIRVYKGYIFVQYDRIDDAKKLIEQGENCLILKGNKLDILPAMDNKLSFNENSYKDYKKDSRDHSDYDRNSISYQSSRKQYTHKQQIDERHIFNNNQNNYRDSNLMDIVNDNDNNNIDLSENNCRRLSRSPNISLNINNERCYTILTGPDDRTELVDCRIIIVNSRQRDYVEEISSYLRCNGLITSIILLKENYTLIEAIENAKNDNCLYGIIVMPIHEQRHTASFHILHGQIQEHRNLTLENGYNIILRNFNDYKQRIKNKSHRQENISTIIYPQTKEYIHQEEQQQQQSIKLGDKFPLSMLLCLLADGRQLTLEEIDRILVYLLEKKSKMLTLPQGTLPPLPAQYANINNVESKTTDNCLSSNLSSTIVEQIRDIISSNLIKSSCLNSTDKSLSNIILNEEKTQFQQQTNPKVNLSFNYPTTNENCYLSSNISLKQTTPIRNSQYLYSSNISNENIYPSLPNSAAADAAAAIFQAYSQFNTQTTSINNQQIQK